MWRSAMAVAAFLLAGASSAPAQTLPRSLVCFPPLHLSAKTCTCEATAARKPACSLVCLDPDQVLDARKCACVRRTR